MSDLSVPCEPYRQLTAAHEEALSEAAKLSERCERFIEVLENLSLVDKRSVSLAKTNLQQGLMWAHRSVLRPASF